MKLVIAIILTLSFIGIYVTNYTRNVLERFLEKKLMFQTTSPLRTIYNTVFMFLWLVVTCTATRIILEKIFLP